MAFRPLTEAECGQANPLAKLTSHVLHDHTFSENHGQIFPSSSDQLVEQFLQETRALPQTFRLDDLRREMHEIESQRAALPPIPASAVKDHLHDDEWAQQYIEDGKTFHTQDHEAVWQQMAQQEQKDYGAMDPIWDMSQNSLQAGPNEIQESARELRGTVDDPRFVYSKFMRFMKNVEDGDDVTLTEGKLTEQEVQAWSEEYFNTDSNKTTTSESVAEGWAEEHVKNNQEEFNAKFWNKLQEDMKTVSNTDDEPHPWLDEYNSYYIPQRDYVFSEENPMFDVAKPLERGKQLLEEGDFPSAVLCFESAVKKEPENAEAWLLLGKTQAENEQDPNAIAALNKCLQLEPTNLTALMALAASYANESYFNQACHTLFTWLKNNPKYSDLVPEDLTLSGQVTSLLNPDDQKVVEDLFIKAAQRQPVNVDHEVQSGLGILFNLSSDYEKAADCFRAALSVKPDDARLWNRLGASLANGARSEEAVDAYHHALNLAPGFIRARYNVGITCINLNAYKEAVEHFLTALNQQTRGKDVVKLDTMSQVSDQIWITLRMCLSLMNKSDLRTAVENRQLDILNKAFDISEN